MNDISSTSISLKDGSLLSLGQGCRDEITGAGGIALAFAYYFDGAVKVLVAPPFLDQQGGPASEFWLESVRLLPASITKDNDRHLARVNVKVNVKAVGDK